MGIPFPVHRKGIFRKFQFLNRPKHLLFSHRPSHRILFSDHPSLSPPLHFFLFQAKNLSLMELLTIPTMFFHQHIHSSSFTSSPFTSLSFPFSLFYLFWVLFNRPSLFDAPEKSIHRFPSPWLIPLGSTTFPSLAYMRTSPGL